MTDKHGEWLPIESAPKDDGVRVVNDTIDGGWVVASYENGDEWSGWVYDDQTAQDSNPTGPMPTHWFFVPPPPTST